MIRRFRHHRGGAAAVEFALICPFLILLMLGGLAVGVAVWNQNILQDAAQESARCAAIGGASCASVPNGCDSSSPAVCYTETVALSRGLDSIKASQISVNSNATSGGVSFTTVTINYTFSLIGYNYTLAGFGSFPNA